MELTFSKQKKMPRGAGVLLPVFSLPSPYGIGTFGKAAYDFVDFLENSKQTYWQVLPLGPTSYGDSPYQSFSAFAGNPYFIDLNLLIKDEFLITDNVTSYSWGGVEDSIDYSTLYKNRFEILEIAFRNKKDILNSKPAQDFMNNNSFWLDDYAFFMALKNHFNDISWLKWPEDIKLRKSDIIEKYKDKLSYEINFWKFCQYIFYVQWHDLKAYANNKGIKIIGDIPIYVALDSSDVWANRELYQLDNEGSPLYVSGVPPDMFSEDGQLWGNPLYNWDAMANDNFSWWKNRMSHSAELFDIIRIDHFIGIVNYFSISADENTAKNGKWEKGPAEKLLNAIHSSLSGRYIIAEDLGVVTPKVKALIRRCGFPEMKVIQFAFDNGHKNPYLPHRFNRNTVTYGGTHDNETLASFFEGQPRKNIRFALDYLGLKHKSQIPKALIEEGYKSNSNVVIYQLQDMFFLDNNARINTPSTIGENWRWRFKKDQIDKEFEKTLKEMTIEYNREP